MATKLMWLCLTIVALTSNAIEISSQAPKASDTVPEQAKGNEPLEQPVVYGKRGDGYPDKLRLEGVISDISFSQDCGFFRGAGVMKIRLSKKIPGYAHEFAYVAAPCLLKLDQQYVDTRVCLNVNKIVAGGRTCHADYIHNTFDSEGVPFYCLTWKSWKFKEFLNEVKCPE